MLGLSSMYLELPQYSHYLQTTLLNGLYCILPVHPIVAVALIKDPVAVISRDDAKTCQCVADVSQKGNFLVSFLTFPI